MGTVELGMPYGLARSGVGRQPNKREAIKLLHAAYDSGIRLFDTAPGYGTSEEVVGKALGAREDARIATKVAADAKSLHSSIEMSLKFLQRDTLDVVQVHNATKEDFSAGELMGALEQLKQRGELRRIGASVYGESAALAAINAGVEVLQVACNILDRRMLERVFPLAQERNVDLLLRSVYLKGVLTERGQYLSGTLRPLAEAAQQVVEKLQIGWDELAEIALRYALRCAENQKKLQVLVGISSQAELNYAINTIGKGALSSAEIGLVEEVRVDGRDWMLDPSKWPRSEQLIG